MALSPSALAIWHFRCLVDPIHARLVFSTMLMRSQVTLKSVSQKATARLHTIATGLVKCLIWGICADHNQYYFTDAYLRRQISK